MSTKIKQLFSSCLVVLLALGLSSCQTTEKKKDIHKRDQAEAQGTRELPKTPKTRGGFPARDESRRPPPTVTAHLWANLRRYGEEEEGFATYTYALVGRDSSHKATWARYNTLIKAIKSSTAEDSPTRTADKSLLNLFLIPVVGGEGQDSTSPNDKLSIQLLTALSTALPGKFENPGPYLITLYKPIRHGHPGEVTDVLFVDLSKKHERAIQEIVRRYKVAIIESKLEGKKKLDDLLTSILSWALTVEDSYGFVRVAFAEVQNSSNTSD